MSFRKTVTHKRDKVWSSNKNKDLYTGWRKSKFDDDEDLEPEVDHIVEVGD